MKRLINLLLALVLILAMSPAVHADVIYIPEDPFLDVHWMNCTEIRRGYTARTDIKVYESPESGRVEGTLPEGKAVHVYYIWTDGLGNQWGYIELYEPTLSGWIPMAYMKMNYDSISFEEDYGHLFETHGDWIYLDESYAGQEIWFWNYPGSERGYTFLLEADYPLALGPTYTDSEGRVWGYNLYHMGHRQNWVCIDDPTADFDTLYPNGSPKVEVTEPLPPLPEQEIKPGFTPSRMIISGGVVLCLIVTAVVLLKKKKKG